MIGKLTLEGSASTVRGAISSVAALLVFAMISGLLVAGSARGADKNRLPRG